MNEYPDNSDSFFKVIFYILLILIILITSLILVEFIFPVNIFRHFGVSKPENVELHFDLSDTNKVEEYSLKDGKNRNIDADATFYTPDYNKLYSSANIPDKHYYNYEVIKSSSLFKNKTFDSIAYFSNTSFQCIASFDSTHFMDSVIYNIINFNSDALFTNAVFDSSVIFRDCQFFSEISFSNSQFGVKTVFSRCEFRGPSYWAGTILPETLDIKYSKYIYDEIDLRSCRLPRSGRRCYLSIYGTDVDKLKINMRLFQLYFPRDIYSFDKNQSFQDEMLGTYEALDNATIFL